VQVEQARAQSGSHERRLATGAIAQPVTLAIGTVTMLGVVTILARRLSLTELGVYGLLISIPAYLLVAQSSVEVAAIKGLAQADAQEERDRVFTTAVVLYACLGLLTGLCIVFGGWALLGVFGISPALRSQARLGLVCLGLLNLVGWPAKTAQDVLRGSHRFVASAVAESVALVTFAVLMTATVTLGAPLWTIAAVGGSLPLLIGLAAVAVLRALRLEYRLRPSTFSLTYAREFLSVSAYLLVSGLADLVIYSCDRAILGAYRPVATVGLYEGPVRAHNLVRQLQGTLVVAVMPAAAVYFAGGDRGRLRDLLIRGTRYVMLVTVPLSVTFMVLAAPILHVWLGSRFVVAAGAMTILVSYWLIAAASGVGCSMLVAAGRVRLIAIFSSCVAASSLAMSLVLTPPLGLNGVVLGTSIPNALAAPVILWIYCRTFDVSVATFLREALLPAYAAGAILALIEGLGLALLPIYRPGVLVGVVVLALVTYAAIIYGMCLRPSERLLIRDVLTSVRHRLTLARPAYRTP
jgi:O-antigen/teichoic acid export membrane protein